MNKVMFEYLNVCSTNTACKLGTNHWLGPRRKITPQKTGRTPHVTAAGSFAQLVLHRRSQEKEALTSLPRRGVAPYGCQTGPCLHAATQPVTLKPSQG